MTGLGDRMSALGQKQTFAVKKGVSALPPKADMCGATRHVRFVPIADIGEIACGLCDFQKKKPPDDGASFDPATWSILLSWVEMLVNLPLSVVPIELTAAMITTEMPAAMRPYSIAVAPDSSFRTQKLATCDKLPRLTALRSRRNARIIKKPCDDAVWTSRLYRDFPDAQGKSAKVFYGRDVEIYDTDICNGSRPPGTWRLLFNRMPHELMFALGHKRTLRQVLA